MREYCLHESRVAENVNLELPVGNFHRYAFDGTQLAKRGIIYQQIDPPLGRYNVLNRSLNAFFVRNIQLDGLNVIRPYLFQPVHAPCHRKYVVPISGEEFGRGPSDPAGRPGYQRNPLNHIFRSFFIVDMVAIRLTCPT
jgi:hypothetical protein